MNTIKTNIERSNGSDGYQAGTWRARVTATLEDGSIAESYDGGNESRAMAVEAGKRLARAAKNWC